MKRSLFICAVFACQLFVFQIFAQPTAFKYQGSLTDGGNPASGSFQMQFRLCKNATCSIQVGQTIALPAVAVTNGVFSVDLEFTSGAVVWENERYLEVGVRRTDQEQFTVLLPRQPVLSAPFSIKAKSADTAASAGTANNAANASNLGGLPPDRYIQSDQNGNVGIGTTPGGSKLTVAGMIETTSGGIKFPNGSVQTAAGLASVVVNAPLTGTGAAASPLGIQSPLNTREINAVSRQPFYSNGSNFVVPAGKLLVIEFVSGLFEQSTTNPLPWMNILINGSTQGFVTPDTWSDVGGGTRFWFFNKPVRFYVTAGQSVSFGNPGFPTSTIKHIWGYFVDVP